MSLPDQCKAKRCVSVSVVVWEYFTPDIFPSVTAVGWILMIAPRGMLVLVTCGWAPVSAVISFARGWTRSSSPKWSSRWLCLQLKYAQMLYTTLPQHTVCPQTQGSAQISEITDLAVISGEPEQLPSIYGFIPMAQWLDRQTLSQAHLLQNGTGGAVICMTWTVQLGGVPKCSDSQFLRPN